MTEHVEPASVLVTGAGGFVGQHLLAALRVRCPTLTLHATARSSISERINVAGERWHALDIGQADAVMALLQRLQPGIVVHLAAQSHVPTSFQKPDLTWQTNLQGTLNLLEGIKHASPHTRLLNVGSADMYGGAFRQGEAVTEDTAFEPLNPYAASKAAADLAAGQYAASDGLRVIRARSFNHTGPGQGDGFVLPAFAMQVARIEAGLQPPVVETGNLDAARDFLDVDDVINAYLALLTLPHEAWQGQAYNIASEQSIAIGELLDRLLAHSRCVIDRRLDPERQRPSDIRTVKADTAALRRATGWKPAVSVDVMLGRLLDDCRRRVASAES